MSRLNICLILLTFGLWTSVYVLKFKEDILEWYHNRFDRTPAPLPPDGKMPEVSLPFIYKDPTPETEAMPASETETATGSEAATGTEAGTGAAANDHGGTPQGAEPAAGRSSPTAEAPAHAP